ncbi:MAG: porin [Flavobacteriales bacterium]|nr:porin [Flavobacteriales bacterium]
MKSTFLKTGKRIFLGVGIMSTSLLSAQEVEVVEVEETGFEKFIKNTEISGSADVYYKRDFANQNNNKTSFTDSNDSFELGMVSLTLTNSFGKAAITADLGFGKRAADFSFNSYINLKDVNGEDVLDTDGNTFNTGSTSPDFMIKQLYLDYALTDALTITAGSWATHVGYELMNAVDNDIYSMSYAFTNGPFGHTGLKANYEIEGGFNIMAGIANPTDYKSATQFDNKYFIWQLGYSGDKFSAYLNGQQGSNNPATDNVSQFGLTAAYQVTDEFKVGFDGTHVNKSSDLTGVADTSWMSLVGYLGYAFNDKVALNYRCEYLDDQDGIITVADNNVLANTLSLTYTEGNLQIKPEIRFESSDKDIYKNSDGKATGSSANFLVGAAYSF